MKIICIDTSMDIISVTASGDNGVFTLSYNKGQKAHSENLINLLSVAVEYAGFQANQTDVIVCPEGPGSFSGLRIAYSTAKAIELSSGAKFITIPTLELLHEKYQNYAEQCLVLIDARRNKYFAQYFSHDERSNPMDEPLDKVLSFINTAQSSVIVYRSSSDISDLLGEQVKQNSLLIHSDDIISNELLKYFLKHQGKLMAIESNDYSAPMYIRKSDAE